MLLHKTTVVDGALKFLDAEGLDGLTMRKLGAALNVQGGALYRHFPNKEALLEAMADKLLEGVADPLPQGPWRDQLYLLGARLRAALLAHPDGARLVAGTYATGPNAMTASDLAVQVLGGTGLAPAQAGALAFALFYYVLGHTLEEQAQVHPAADEDWRQLRDRTDSTVSPQYAQALDALTSTAPAERFAYGLNVFLDGVAGQIPSARLRRSTPHRAAR